MKLRVPIVSHYLLATFLFVSCVKAPEESSSIEYSVDSLFIELPRDVSPNLSNPCIWESENGELLAAYSYQDHSISLFNLSNRKFIRKVVLKKEGPDFVENVDAIGFYSEDTIIIAGANYLTMLGLDGEVVKRVGINLNRGELK